MTPPIVDIPSIISGVCQNPKQVRQPNGTCADRPVCKENERFEGPSGQCVCKSDYEKLPNATDCTLKQTTAKPELKLELRTKKTDSAIYDATVDNEAVLPAGGYNIIWTREGVDAPADDTKFNDPAVVTPASSIPLRDDPVIQPADSENAPPTSGSIYQSHPLPVVYVNQQISTILSIGDGDVDANGDGSIPVDTTTNAGTMREGQTNIAERSGFSLEAPLLPDGKTYKVCARLYKGEEFVAEACQTVPAKEAAAVTPAAPVNNGLNGNGMGMPGPMGPTRGGPSDAVFRGIR